jgi:hypothetical protein
MDLPTTYRCEQSGRRLPSPTVSSRCSGSPSQTIRLDHLQWLDDERLIASSNLRALTPQGRRSTSNEHDLRGSRCKRGQMMARSALWADLAGIPGRWTRWMIAMKDDRFLPPGSLDRKESLRLLVRRG